MTSSCIPSQRILHRGQSRVNRTTTIEYSLFRTSPHLTRNYSRMERRRRESPRCQHITTSQLSRLQSTETTSSPTYWWWQRVSRHHQLHWICTRIGVTTTRGTKRAMVARGLTEIFNPSLAERSYKVARRELAPGASWFGKQMRRTKQMTSRGLRRRTLTVTL